MKGGIDLDISDLRRLEGEIKALGGIPQTCVTQAARKGANVVLKAARKKAPRDTGNLKRGMVLRAEKARTRGKKVYRIAFRPDMNSVFLKDRKGDEHTSGATGVYYYPAHQEYGYMLRNGQYKQGQHFMRDAANEKAGEMSGVVIKVLSEKIEERWGKWSDNKKGRRHKR